MSDSFSIVKIATLVAAGALLASYAPALALQKHELKNSGYAAACDHNGRAWNDRFNADDQDPALALRYRHEHPTSCNSAR